MNFGCYFCGVLAALIYDQLSLKQYKLRELKSFQLLWFTLIPVGILWMFSAHPIFQHYYVAPSAIWGALYAGLQRNIWGFGLGIFIVGMASKVGCKYRFFSLYGFFNAPINLPTGIFRKFSCLPIFRILGRLTYGAFIVHLLVARIVLATVREPIYFGTGMMVSSFVHNLQS